MRKPGRACGVRLILTAGAVACFAAAASGAAVIVGPVYNAAAQHYYYLLEPSSWTDAEATAVTLGGHLTTIDNQAEQDWVLNTFRNVNTGAAGCFGLSGNRPDGLWVGLNDAAAEGTFVWADGSTVTYTNWAPGEPFDTGIEDYTAMSNNSPTGQWLDVPDTVGTCRACGVVEVAAVTINGFNPDWIYCPQGFINNSPPPDNGDFIAYDATTGVLMQTLKPGSQAPDGTGYWGSATFALTGFNQARLYTAKKSATGGSPSVRVEEWNASGTVLRSVLITALPGGPASPIGVSVEVGGIRYSSFHGTLFVSVTPHIEGIGSFPPHPPAMVYELDLGLTQVLNAYTGPEMIDGRGTPKVEINPNDGTLYLVGPSLGGAVGSLVKFTSTTTWTTLIDGATYPAGDPLWIAPNGATYRGTNHPGDNRPTILIQNTAGSATSVTALEFYLDQTDGNGNLVKRQNAYTSRRSPGSIQLDEYTGTTMGCRTIREASGAKDSGIDQLLTDDTRYRPPIQSGVNDRFFQRPVYDAASPGFRISAVDPISKQTSSAFLNGPASPGSIAFTVRNKGYTNSDPNVNFSIDFSVSKVPDDASTAWLKLDKTSVNGLAPGARDTVTASINAAGLAAGLYAVELHFMDNAVPANVHSRMIELSVLECSWEVSPTPTTTAYVLAAPLPHAYPITIRNLQGADISFTVQEVAADGVTTQNHAWLSVSPTSGGPISAGSSETVMFTVNSPNQANLGYLRFTPSCGTATSGAQPQVRTISVINTLAGGQPVISQYDGNVDPIAADSCGPGCNFELTADEGNMLMGAVIVDPDAYDQKSWRIQDDNIASTWTHYRSSNNAPGVGDAAHGGTHNGNLGSTLVARLKVPGNTAAGTMLGINLNQAPSTAARVEWGGAGPTLPGLVQETFRGATGLDNGSTSGGYTIIRMTSGFGTTGSRSIRIYVNEDKKPLPVPLEVLSLANLGNGPGGRGFGYGFGMEGTGAVTGEVWFDWVVFTTAGMFAPGEEVDIIGRSLIPESCNDPFADSDDDGDVDLDDFAAFQRCYTGSVAVVTDDCICFDRNADSHVSRNDFGDPLHPEVNTFVACASGADVPADPNCDNGP